MQIYIVEQKVDTVEIAIQVLISIITFLSFVLVTFALFKIPLTEHHKIITIISFSLGMVHYYTRFVIETQLFGIIGLSFFIVLLMVLKRYPIFYSLIVCCIGFLVVGLIDYTISMSSIQLGIVDREMLDYSFVHYVSLNLVASCLAFVLAAVLRFFNIGFSFVIRRYSGSQILKSYNFIWAGIIALSVAVIQISSLLIDKISLHFYVFTIIVLGIFLTLTVAYRQNKKSLKDRYGR